jgi:hypothetical protein
MGETTFRVIALDPGEQTGWATYTAPTRGMLLMCVGGAGGFTSGTLGPEKHGHLLTHLLENQAVLDYHVVSEKFIAQPDNPGKEDISLQYQGVAQAFCNERRLPLHLQTPSQAKTFVINASLKKLGLYIPGSKHRHEMDAMRHLLWYMIHRLGYKQLVSMGWDFRK